MTARDLRVGDRFWGETITAVQTVAQGVVVYLASGGWVALSGDIRIRRTR